MYALLRDSHIKHTNYFFFLINFLKFSHPHSLSSLHVTLFLFFSFFLDFLAGRCLNMITVLKRVYTIAQDDNGFILYHMNKMINDY